MVFIFILFAILFNSRKIKLENFNCGFNLVRAWMKEILFSSFNLNVYNKPF